MNTVLLGDSLELLATLPAESVDSCVTDPPYELGFMGKKWDATGIANKVELWAQVLRVLKPGGHLLAFGGTRTHHRMVCAIEDAGFEIRDEIQWLYGSGFPKSLDVSKAIDKAAGAEREAGIPGPHYDKRGGGNGSECYGDGIRDKKTALVSAPASPDAAQWSGWGTALKPACEPICVARKPLVGTVAANVLQHGTGGINVDAGRIVSGGEHGTRGRNKFSGFTDGDPNDFLAGAIHAHKSPENQAGRWPANVLLTHAAGCNGECVEGCPVKVLNEQSGPKCGAFAPVLGTEPSGGMANIYAGGLGRQAGQFYGDTGGASRFFYVAKASRKERGECNTHPTVKPLKLMRYLVRLVTPPGGLVLDPFAGSGSTLLAAREEGFRYLGCEREAAHVAIIQQRLADSCPLLPVS